MLNSRYLWDSQEVMLTCLNIYLECDRQLKMELHNWEERSAPESLDIKVVMHILSSFFL